ncbi:MAG TPA: preprotein translocase subunit SecE [Armatimonadetes bacterium]|jgi:preprotein translocase subunit SecE|nr:preprotein translocase subunit SecE [Armatimonadota bacterium]
MANTSAKNTPARNAPKGTSAKKEGVFARAGKFLRETWIELKKTSWPNRDELQKSTLLVLAAVTAVTIWIGGLDYLLVLIARSINW